jgi:type IV pilus biogenesis protein CpaD/CtpE
MKEITMKNILICAALALVAGCGDKDDEDTGEDVAETTGSTTGTETGTGTEGGTGTTTQTGGEG